MERAIFLDKAKNVCEEIYGDLSLSEHSTFRIGGKAEFAAFPKSADEIRALLLLAAENGIKTHVVGNASNILFDSGRIDGLIIFTNKMNNVHTEGDMLCADCGASLSLLSRTAMSRGLTGLEFVYGIPGTVGGAVYMNAGAYGSNISDVIFESVCFSPSDGKTVTLSREEHRFGYRKSIFQEENLIVLSSSFKLDKGETSAIENKMRENSRSRKEKQPLEFPSAGSVFKRPEGTFAGKLIEDSGLKGTRCGGAEISEKHAGFIINRGDATSDDVLSLMETAKITVAEKFGITLEPEIIYIK